jgi:hypothetical protein
MCPIMVSQVVSARKCFVALRYIAEMIEMVFMHRVDVALEMLRASKLFWTGTVFIRPRAD